MKLHVDFERLTLAHKTVRSELLADRARDGCWTGHVASSPMATAAAINALVVAHRRVELSCCGTPQPSGLVLPTSDDDGSAMDAIVDGPLSELLVGGLHWLARVQNADGGWGDCESAQSSLAATAMVQSAFRLTGVPAKYSDLMARADHYVATHGGLGKLRKAAGGDKAWAAPVLVNCALAGMVPWRQVPAVAFELRCRPAWGQWLSSPVLDGRGDESAVQVALGRAKFHHAPPRNVLLRFIRRACLDTSLTMLQRWQSDDGSYLASPLSTAIVVMSLASSGFREHPIVEKGVEFLLASVRPDANWPVVSDLATRNTAAAINSLTCGHDDTDLHDDESSDAHADEQLISACCAWLLSCQLNTDRRPTGIPAGGWGWSASPGAVANVADSAAVLLALARCRNHIAKAESQRVERAVTHAVVWLLEQQAAQGGWSEYASEPEDRRPSQPCAANITADALCALDAWRQLWQDDERDHPGTADQKRIRDQISSAVSRGVAWLMTAQRPDGSFTAAGIGSEHHADRQNAVYGTARVLAACDALGQLQTTLAIRAADWLSRAQHTGGGWGPPRAPLDYSGAVPDGSLSWRPNEAAAKSCSVEETAWAISALLPLLNIDSDYGLIIDNGLAWLVNAVENDLHRRPAVVGVWQGKLWYYDRLTPLTAAAGALSRAARELPRPEAAKTLHV